jgi:hypothetical protein
MDVLVGTDFFTVEVLTLKGLVTYYVLFFIQLESRRVCLAEITPHPEQQWMEQMGRNVTMQKWGFLANSRCLLHDRDTKFCMSFPSTDQGGKGENHAPTNQESEFERLCGTLGEIGETGMPVEAHPVWGEAAAPSPAAICGPLPRGAQSPGQAEPAPVPLAESKGKRG